MSLASPPNELRARNGFAASHFALGEVIAVATIVALTCANVLVGVTGFEPAASSSRTKRATKLRHTPWPSLPSRSDVVRR